MLRGPKSATKMSPTPELLVGDRVNVAAEVEPRQPRQRLSSPLLSSFGDPV